MRGFLVVGARYNREGQQAVVEAMQEHVFRVEPPKIAPGYGLPRMLEIVKPLLGTSLELDMLGRGTRTSFDNVHNA